MAHNRAVRTNRQGNAAEVLRALCADAGTEETGEGETEGRTVIPEAYRPCPGCEARYIPLRDALCRLCVAGGVVARAEAQNPAVEAQTAYPCPADAYEGSEKEFQRICENRLTSAGVRWPIHLPPNVRALNGLTDLLWCERGIAFAAELKVKGGRVKPAQIEAMARLKADGWRVGVCWNLREFDELRNQKRGMG